MAAEVRQNLYPNVPLVVHFDGKLLTNLEGRKNDRLAIVVSGLGLE